jgi:uncharacterized membrane protein
MSTPNEPADDRPQYPSYPSTPHPEDAPGYGVGYGAGYAGYGAGQPPYGQPSYTQPQGTGKVQPMEAVSWAFGAVFRNWLVWIVGGLVLGLLVLGGSMLIELAFGGFSAGAESQSSIGYQGAQLIFGLALAALMVFIYHGALRQVDKAKIGLGDFTDNVNFGPAFGLSILLQVVTSVLFAILAVPLFLAANPIGESQMSSTDESLAFLGGFFAGLALVMLIAVLIAPLTMFMVWYVIDRRAGVRGGIAEGFRAGLRNYGRLLAFNIVAGLIVGVTAIVTFGLALIVLAPAMLLMQAMMFRQAAAGPLPAPVTR